VLRLLKTPFDEMAAPNSNPNGPSEKKRRIDPRLVLIIILVAIGVAGFLIAAHHQPNASTTSSNNEANAFSNTTKTVSTPTNTSAPSNVSIPVLRTSIAFSFNLTNSTQGNELVTLKNGEIYFRISGYFNQFPTGYPTVGFPTYAYYTSPNSKLFVLYMVITAYNGSSSKSVILPVFTSVDYNKQQYFVYQAEGDLPQLYQLVYILKQNEFIAVTFYTNSSEILGYTIW
jgi:hypothetical protein